MHINSSYHAITVHEEKRIDKPARNMSNYKKKGTDYTKTPLMVH